MTYIGNSYDNICQLYFNKKIKYYVKHHSDDLLFSNAESLIACYIRVYCFNVVTNISWRYYYNKFVLSVTDLIRF